MGSAPNEKIASHWHPLPPTTDSSLHLYSNDQIIGESSTYLLNNYYDPSSQNEIYRRRLTSAEPIVQAYAWEYENKGSALKPKNQFKVIYERIPYNLSSAPNLSFGQSLYVLDSSLAGFRKLYQESGPFDVTAEMIGFNQQGHVKVWHNSCLAQNHPQLPRHYLISSSDDRSPNLSRIRQESEMVRSIVNVVELKCEEGRFPQSTRLKIQLKQRDLGFAEARALLSEAIEQDVRNGGYRYERIDLQRNRIYRQKILTETNTLVERPAVERPAARKLTGYKFNYEKPAEYFHPEMYPSGTEHHYH